MFYSKHGASAKGESRHYWKWLFKVCFKIFMQYIWTIFNKITLTREWNTIEIEKSLNIQDILIGKYYFALVIFDRNKNTEILIGKCWRHLLSIRKSLEESRTIFSEFHPQDRGGVIKGESWAFINIEKFK